MPRLDDVIPWFQGDEFVDKLAFSLWSYHRYVGRETLSEGGSWERRKNEYLSMARYIAEDLDRTAAA